MRSTTVRLCALFCLAVLVCAAPRAARAEGACTTLDCKQTTAASARRIMGYRTRHAARASVLVAMHDATHVRLTTNLLYGAGPGPLSAVVDNNDARSIADALYNLLSFAYQKDDPEITDDALRAAVARQPIYVERTAYHEALEFFSFAGLTDVRIYDAPRRATPEL